MKSTLRLLLPCLLLANTPVFGQQVIFVKADAAGNDDGTSWANAFVSLQDALSAAASGDEIWVAAGTYRPDDGGGLTPGDRSLSFVLKSGVRVLGGFAGSEASKGGRDRSAHVSILTGDLAGDDDGFVRRTDNSHHVVRADGVNDDTLLEGFTVVGGQADGSEADSLGGGIYIAGGSPWIINVRVNSSDARCGGGAAAAASATPTFVNVVLNGNRAVRGGGLCNVDSDPEVVNATITANLAYLGAGVYNVDASPSITNSIVYANRNVQESAHCEIWQHPCALADVPADVLERDDAVMAGATDAFLNGTMDDAINYVSNHADVVQVLTDSSAVAWRVAGGTLSALVDGTEQPINVEPFGKRGSSNASPSTSISAHTAAVPSGFASALPPTPGRSIIGEDWNGDGEINNRDGKRALILSPFGFGDAEFARELLSETPGYYGGNTIYLDPWVLREDVGLAKWSIWDDFDFIFASTFAQRLCQPSSIHIQSSEEDCEDWIVVTGRKQNFVDVPYVLRANLVAILDSPGPDFVVIQDVALLDIRFFGWQYGGTLDNAVVYCSHCFLSEGASVVFHRALSIVADPAPFTKLSWREKGELNASLPDIGLDAANATVLTKMGFGAPDLHWRVELPASIVQIQSQGAVDPRIIELPVLMLESEDAQVAAPMTELADVSDMIVGTIDDEEPDAIVIRELVYGVASDEDEINFTLTFEIGGNEIPGQYGLLSAAPTVVEYARDFRDTLDLGFPVESGLLPMKAIVDLGDGTESSYVVNASVDAFACSAKASFNGYETGVFTGAAWWSGDPEAEIVGLTLESTTTILAKGPEPELGLTVSDYDLSFIGEDPEIALTDDGLEIVLDDAYTVLTRRHTTNGWAARHTTTGGDCEECYARFFGLVDSSNVFEGEFEFLLNHSDATPSEPLLISGSGKFRAVPGNLQDIETPYWQCANEYWTAYELVTGN